MTYTEGKTYHGFTLEKQQFIDEINSQVYLFNHEKLHCPLVAIKNNDSNKTFTVSFNTIPEDSTGVAHILEHSVLMGSEKYPVKDVFGEINKGGLTTYLNALTGSDITYYPFATRNIKEYFNIMDVYCDVVFHPQLLKTTFEQEGWHHHLESNESELQYQGVVYNEMKGAFSDPIRLIFHHIFKGLLPGSTYSHESGGDPKDIPSLSHEAFCAFHKKHYHPSNATFFVYGDADLDTELQFLQDRFLAQYKTAGKRCSIAEGILENDRIFIEDRYSVETSDTKNKTFLAVGTRVGEVHNRIENVAFQIIANILFNSDGSPLKDAIISSDICRDFGGFYLSSACYKTFMITYLVGSEEEKREKFLTLYHDTLSAMAKNGLEKDLVIAELNKFEFSFREEASNAQRGLDLIGKALSAIKYHTDPFEQLTSEDILATVRKKALSEGYFEELITKHLLTNDATAVVTLIPDPEKGTQIITQEKEELASYKDTLNAKQQQELIAKTQELMALQLTPNTEKALQLLPRLQLDDLSIAPSFHTPVIEKIDTVSALINDLPTNRISYLDMGFDLSTLPTALLSWLDIFATIVTEIGTQDMDFKRFAKEIATYTGSLSHSFSVYRQHDKKNEILPVFWLHTKCLPGYLEKTLELITSVLKRPSFEDRKHIREIVAREFAWAEHSVQSEGYTLPVTRVFSHFNTAGIYNELINGVSAYRALKELVMNYEQREASFLAALEEIASTLFNRNTIRLCFTGEEKEIACYTKLIPSLLSELPEHTMQRHIPDKLSIARNEAFITSAEVAFVVEGSNIFPEGQGYNGHFEVLKTYLTKDYLWNSVRQMGGAYGCFIQFNHLSGNMVIVSYRDPQVGKTYEAYAKIPENIANLDLTEKVLDQLIIGTYGAFDPHQSPYMKATTARNEYFSGITPEFKLNRLQEISETTLADLKSFAPALSSITKDSYRAVIGNRTKIEQDGKLFDVISEL